MKKKLKLLLYKWLNSGGGSTESLLDTILSYRTAPSQKANVQRVSATWRIWTPIDEEYAQFYDTAKEISADDDYWALDSAWGIMKYFEIRLPDSTSGTYTNATSASGYTTQVGATATITFKGTGMKFSSVIDNRGGIWRATANTGETIDFSVYNSSSSVRLSDVFPPGTFDPTVDTTVVFTFQGADPLNPPSGGTARGWISRDSVTVSNAGRYQKAFYIIGSPTPNCSHDTMTVAHTKYTLCSGPSHKEFAFSTRARSGTVAIQNQWIPNHSAIATTKASIFANLTTDRTITVDGGATNYLTSFTDAFTFAVGGDSVVLHEVYEGCNIDDEPLSLFDIINTYTWTMGGLSIYVRMEALVNLYNTTGYLSMHDAEATQQTHSLCNGIEFDNTDNTGGLFDTLVTQGELPTWNGNSITVNKTGTDLAKSFCVGMNIRNISSAFNLSNSAYLQEVRIQGNGTRGKLYPAVVNNIEIDQGEVFEWTSDFTIGIVPDAYNELKSYVGL
jgi:hypothetical protein